MNAVRIVVRRLANLLVLLLAVSLVTFALLYLTGSDPARALVGARNVSEEQLEAIRAQYHLDEPLWQQYLRWLGNILTGDLGTSTRTQLPVADMIAGKLGVTALLAVMALGIALLVGLPLGVVAAKHQGRWQDKVIGALSVTGLAAPSFAVGLLLLYVLAVGLGVFPIYGLGDGTLADTLWHLALPALTLAVGILASVVKISRAALIDEVNSDYTLFARSRGLSPAAITASQLRNAALPIMTSSGLLMASLFSGTVIVETLFSVGGIGTLLQQSVTFGDIPCVQAITLVLATLICGTTALVDTLSELADPRLRHRGAAPAKAAVPAKEA